VAELGFHHDWELAKLHKIEELLFDHFVLWLVLHVGLPSEAQVGCHSGQVGEISEPALHRGHRMFGSVGVSMVRQ
jgi:hypothetical protein